ncbi:hypothetical protein BGZ73_000628 [Actinomortierella ambigua]|nr:hypothetical protein BGZ73_000628 [Actinomortierella ambigua]
MADIVSIPEVAIVFRACLSRKDLAGCVRVSKEWYATFSPLLWRSVRTSFYSPVYFQQHFKNAIPRWGEFIHNLDAYEFFHLHSFIGHTNNLSALRVRTPSLFMGLGWRFMLDIAMANPLITTLHLGAVGNISNPKSDDLLRVIRCLPRLDHLELRFVHKTQAVAELPSKHLLTILTIWRMARFA